jgi:hypothetical protein
MLEYLSKIQQKDSFPAYPPSLRYTDEYVDFLYSSVEKNVEWGDEMYDIYLGVEFLGAPRWIVEPRGLSRYPNSPANPPPIAKGSAFPRVRISPADEEMRGSIHCDLEVRPYPAPCPIPAHPPHTSFEERLQYLKTVNDSSDEFHQWKEAIRDNLFPRSICLLLAARLDSRQWNEPDTSELRAEFRVAIDDALDDQLERYKRVIEAFPEWFLVKGVTSR